jgi:hypothetical protein
MASGPVNRIKRPNTWLHRPMLQNVKKALANPEPSTHGTKGTRRSITYDAGMKPLLAKAVRVISGCITASIGSRKLSARPCA